MAYPCPHCNQPVRRAAASCGFDNGSQLSDLVGSVLRPAVAPKLCPREVTAGCSGFAPRQCPCYRAPTQENREPAHIVGRGRLAMSESQQSRVFMFDSGDPEMQRAYENARATFRYFWREVAWERRRIIPALDLASVKAPFSDGEQGKRAEDTPEVEHMWLSDVDFDGQFVSGVLLNAPNWLKTVNEGDPVRIPLSEISDWMYSIGDEVFGAYTVNLLRSRMGRAERQEHDSAWGLNFGDPTKIRVAPESNQGGGLLKNWFGKRQADTQEHPMSEAMAGPMKEQLANDPSLVSARDDRGWTFLHQEALAGSTATVKVLLEAGADPNAVTNHGMTPLELARSLGWDNVVAILARK